MSGNTGYDTVKEALKSEEDRLLREQEKKEGIFLKGWVVKKHTPKKTNLSGVTPLKKRKKQ